MSSETPTQRAWRHIREIEKRYKSPEKRKEAACNEALFWSSVWTSLGLQRDPERQAAIQIFKNYIEGD